MPVTSGDSNTIEEPEWLSQMETVLEVLNEGVIVIDERQHILFANTRFLEMTGISHEEIARFDPSQFYSSQEWDFLSQQTDVAFRAGRNRYSFVLPRKGGGRLPVIVSSRMIQNSGAKFRIATFTDISEQVHAQEELRAANAKLQTRQMEIEEDLRLAARVQRSLAPKRLVWDNMSVNGCFLSSRALSIGGDFRPRKFSGQRQSQLARL